jgi:putative phosphoribosyl transferase
MFRDREEAGRLLAQALAAYQRRPSLVVLGLPRGGVPVARIVADFLGAPLDVFLVRKLGVPWQPELGFGAIAETPGAVARRDPPVRVLDTNLIRECELRPEVIDQIAAREQREIDRRSRLYRGTRALIDISGRDTCDTLRREADDVVCLSSPEPFQSVGTWYEDFTQITDHEVRHALSPASFRP